MEEQFFGRITDMVRRTDGDELTADAAIGATTLYVGDVTDFDEDGGMLVLGTDDPYAYSTVDVDANTITLLDPLVTAASTGDQVTCYDEQLEEIVVEYVAHVLLDDQDRDDEPIEVTVPHFLVNYIKEEVRGGYAEAVTLVRDGEDDLMIWQVEGKLVNDIAIEAVKGGYGGSLQDLYDYADAAAAAAADAAANATVALAAANGKNKVVYSLTTPGSTANTAGDIWFQKESATQTIIGQWEGLGGTSWSQKTLANAVIANLDAGKLTAGSAFTNALSVKTNFTLGDASTNGVLQSYNFAGSSVGVYMDKFGIVAKGGSLAGAAITGGSVIGTSITSGSSGYRTRLSTSQVEFINGSSSVIGGMFGGSIGASDEVSIYCGSARIDLKSHGELDFTSGAVFNDNVEALAGLHVDSGATITGGLAVTGNSTFANKLTASGELHGDTLWADSVPTTGTAANAVMGASGQLLKSTSSKRYKKNVKAAKFDVRTLLALIPRTFQSRSKADDPDRRRVGFVAEEAHELGLTEWVEYDEQGRPDGFAYPAWVAALQHICREQQTQIDALTQRLEALEAQR